MQGDMSKANKTAWETKAYQAWVQYHGTPDALAEELKRTHRHHLRYWLKYTGDPAGKRIVNLLGSHGRKAISFALMGADVTVVDISEENRRYALETAEAAGVKLGYICADALQIPDEERLGRFDVVLMEFGILHYFADLNAIFGVVRRLLREGGQLLLTDFHPFARAWLRTDLLTEPTGHYFDERVREGEVAFAKLLPEEERGGLENVKIRSWTVGDIVTALGTAGLFIRVFEEIPSARDPRFPEFYTIAADKIEPPRNR